MDLQCVVPERGPWPLHGSQASRAAETAGLASTPAQALMQRAGFAVAQLALAIAPHARRITVLCGPGNNGGDGLVAALQLQRAGREVHTVLFGDPAWLPADAADAHARAIAGGLPITTHWNGDGGGLIIDALLGLGSNRAPEGAIADAITRANTSRVPVLAVDLPSGLQADTGAALGGLAMRATTTLSLLTLKPGLFTHQGRDHAGTVWLHRLGVDAGPATAWLGGPPALAPRPHASHKGSYGDVIVAGGSPGMAGAAWLAARAALAAGAGRVYTCLLDTAAPGLDPSRPELMSRPLAWLTDAGTPAGSTVVCGCGGGDAVAAVLPALLVQAPRLVLDADALNAIAGDSGLQALLARRAQPAVLTPHPLEAARLLGSSTADVQNNRLAAAQQLAERCQAVVVLKGSGTVIAAPGAVPVINGSGNALLASPGTGDVLAGWLGGLWAQAQARPGDALAAAQAAVWQHGHAADLAARQGRTRPLQAASLVEAMQRG